LASKVEGGQGKQKKLQGGGRSYNAGVRLKPDLSETPRELKYRESFFGKGGVARKGKGKNFGRTPPFSPQIKELFAI